MSPPCGNHYTLPLTQVSQTLQHQPPLHQLTVVPIIHHFFLWHSYFSCLFGTYGGLVPSVLVLGCGNWAAAKGCWASKFQGDPARSRASEQHGHPTCSWTVRKDCGPWPWQGKWLSRQFCHFFKVSLQSHCPQQSCSVSLRDQITFLHLIIPRKDKVLFLSSWGRIWSTKSKVSMKIKILYYIHNSWVMLVSLTDYNNNF